MTLTCSKSVRGNAISTARIITGRSMLGSSMLCAVTIEGKKGKWMKPAEIEKPRWASACNVV